MMRLAASSKWIPSLVHINPEQVISLPDKTTTDPKDASVIGQVIREDHLSGSHCGARRFGQRLTSAASQ